MPRRVNLPGATELFRPTTTEARAAAKAPAESAAPDPSGRVRHDQKITVYLSTEELLALETARLRLRAEFGVAADRGRIVRAAIAATLGELEVQGQASDLVQRLQQ